MTCSRPDVYWLPGNKHMKVKHMPLGDVVVLTEGRKVNGHRPSVDVLMTPLRWNSVSAR